MAHWKVLSCTQPAGQANDWVDSNGTDGKPTFHRRTNLSSCSKICNHFREIEGWSQKSLTMIKVFWKKERANFQKVFPKGFTASQNHVVCKFRENWLTRNRQSRALFTWQKTKLLQGLPLSLLRGSRPKSVRARPPAPNNVLGVPQISSKIPNPFTSGGVIAERVNIVETRHKVFPILGEEMNI